MRLPPPSPFPHPLKSNVGIHMPLNHLQCTLDLLDNIDFGERGTGVLQKKCPNRFVQDCKKVGKVYWQNKWVMFSLTLNRQ